MVGIALLDRGQLTTSVERYTYISDGMQLLYTVAIRNLYGVKGAYV